MRLMFMPPLAVALVLAGQLSFAQPDATDAAASVCHISAWDAVSPTPDDPGRAGGPGCSTLRAASRPAGPLPILSLGSKGLSAGRRNTLAVLLLAALAEPIHKADADIYHWSVQERAEQEEPTGRVMSALTQSGQLIFVLPVVGLSVGGGDVRHASSEALRAELVTTAFVETLKKLTRRPRPEGGEGSFPSGHAAAAFAEATTIASYYPNLRVPLYTWAAGVAASRVYLGRHYLTDVLVGSALGIWVAKSVHKNKSWPLGIRW